MSTSLVRWRLGAALWVLAAALSSAASAAVLYDQRNHYSPSPQGAVPFQDFLASSLDAFDSFAADDFTVPAGQIWAIDKIKADLLTDPSGGGVPLGIDVVITLEAAGIQPGAEVCRFANVKPEPIGAPGPHGRQGYELLLPSPCQLCAGTKYWLVLQARGPDSPEFAWSQRTVQSGSVAKWKNPGNGSGTGCFDWEPAVGICYQGDQVSPDLTFALEGTSQSPGFVKGDLDGDLCVDLLFRNAATNENKAWLMKGTVRSSESAISPNPPSGDWRLTAADDFNADGKTDLVFVNAATNAVEFWIMNGTTRVGSPVALTGAPPLPLDWQLEASGRLSTDTQPDLLYRNTVSRDLVVWVMNGTTKVGEQKPSPSAASAGNWRIAGVADYSGDGRVDFLWNNNDSARSVIWFMDATLTRTSGAFTNPDGPLGVTNWRICAVGDYGVGTATDPPQIPRAFSQDMVWQNDLSQKTVVWHFDFARNRTGGLFTQPDGPGAPWLCVGPR